MDETIEVKTRWRFVKTRLTQTEYMGFVLVLLKLGTTGAWFLRKAVREAIQEGPDLLVQELQVFREAIYQLGAIGRNLNQLLHTIHSGKLTGHSIDAGLLEAIQEKVEKLEDALKTLVIRARRRMVLVFGRVAKRGR